MICRKALKRFLQSQSVISLIIAEGLIAIPSVVVALNLKLTTIHGVHQEIQTPVQNKNNNLRFYNSVMSDEESGDESSSDTIMMSDDSTAVLIDSLDGQITTLQQQVATQQKQIDLHKAKIKALQAIIMSDLMNKV